MCIVHVYSVHDKMSLHQLTFLSKTTTYTCELTLSNRTANVQEFGRFPSGIGDNGEVSFTWKYPAKSGHGIDLLIKKTNELPIKADMTFTAKRINCHTLLKTKSMEDWKELFYFDDLNLTTEAINQPITIILEITWTLPDSLVWPKPTPPICLEISDFSLSSTFSDVTILIDDEKIFSHKLILGAASPVWLSTLTSPMKEAEENSIIIKDVEVDVMKCVLKFLYTGKHEDFDDFRMAMKALVVAEKYAMDKFKAVIEEKLFKCVTIDNALEILDHADTHRAETLKKACMKFIIERSNEVIDNEHSDQIFVQKPLLMKEFTVAVIRAAIKWTTND